MNNACLGNFDRRKAQTIAWKITVIHQIAIHYIVFGQATTLFLSFVEYLRILIQSHTMRAQIQSESTTTTTTTLDVTKPSTTSSAAAVDKQNRIPSALQVVFLSSNRGSEVNQPPPARVADKVYVRNWRFRQQGDGPKNGIKRRSSFTSGENEDASRPIIRRDSMPKLDGARRKKKLGLPEDEVRSGQLLRVAFIMQPSRSNPNV
jgi:hypothetical protein